VRIWKIIIKDIQKIFRSKSRRFSFKKCIWIAVSVRMTLDSCRRLSLPISTCGQMIITSGPLCPQHYNTITLELCLWSQYKVYTNTSLCEVPIHRIEFQFCYHHLCFDTNANIIIFKKPLLLYLLLGFPHKLDVSFKT
jgi:hypothetical protein